jgi:hypothetical protein
LQPISTTAPGTFTESNRFDNISIWSGENMYGHRGKG